MKTPFFRSICVTRRGQEQLLCDELHSRNPGLKCNRVGPQVVEISSGSIEELAEFPIFFSSQLLPHPEKLHADSIHSWARVICDRLLASEEELLPHWQLHVFDPLSAETGSGYARPARIREAVVDILKQKRRSLLRALSDQPSRDCALVQVLTISPTDGYSSVAAGTLRKLFRSALSPHVAGFIDIPDDKRPPSRAFKKLREAIAAFELSIRSGDTAVDLGASPGGWTHVMRQHGASVTAVDRSPLTDSLMHDPKVSFVRGNAHTWTPQKAVDWLVCDVITTPASTFSILKLWISKKLCRNFCVTIKFKGTPELDTLFEIVTFLKDNTTWFDGKQLTHNKNEVTVVGAISL